MPMAVSDRHATASAFLQCLAPATSIASTFRTWDAATHDRFLRWIEAHRIAPQLHAILTGVDLPATLADHLKASVMQALPLNLALKGAGDDLRKRLSDDGIDSLPFKGPYLAEFLFDGSSHRWCYDVDLFVREKDLLRARGILLSMGYEAEGPEAPLDLLVDYRHELGFVHPKTTCRIELHWRIVPAFMPCRLTVDDLFEYARPDLHHPGTSHLPAELAFVLLAVHGNRHAWSHLCWLLDLVQMVQKKLVNLEEVLVLAKRFALQKTVGTALALMGQIPGVSVPTPDSAIGNMMLKSAVDGWFEDPPPHEPSYSYLAASLDSTGQRCRFWARLLFQPTVADFNLLPLPRPLRWMNACLRPFRLLNQRKRTQ